MTVWPALFAAFLTWLGRNSLQACFLVGLILALQAALRDRISPRWHYALWLILVAKLALPWAPPSPLSVYNLLPTALRPTALTATNPTTAQVEPAPLQAAVSPNETAAATSHIDPAAPALANKPAPTTAAPRPTWRYILPLTWLAGALLVAVFTFLQALRLGAIRRERFVTDQSTLELLEDCKQQMRVPAYLALVETPRVASPALFGCIRPRLLLPAGAIRCLGPQRLRHVFLHELAHLKRHDIGVNWVLTILQILHWFNPLVWYAFAQMRNERELACDALALSHSGAPDPHDYGRTIVDMLETLVTSRRQPGLAGVLEDKSQLKRRISMIAQFHRSASTTRSLPALALLLLVAVAALTNAQTTQPALDPAVTITARDVEVVPNPDAELGTSFVVVKLVNNTDKPVKEFNVRFFRGDPTRGGKSLGIHSAGPLKPGQVWRERSRDLALRDGVNDFTVVLGPPDRPIQEVPPQHRASIHVIVENGKIVDTAPQAGTQSLARPTVDNDRLLNDQQRRFLEGMEQKEAAALDASAYTNLSPAAKNELIIKWLAALKNSRSPNYEQAINGLAAIGDERAVNPILWIAAERRQKDNRDRWMATRALGLLGQKHVIPLLIPLTYHYNYETAVWAQISLVRLSGRNFGDDWQAWAKWSNEEGKGLWPVVDPHKIAWPGADQARD